MEFIDQNALRNKTMLYTLDLINCVVFDWQFRLNNTSLHLELFKDLVYIICNFIKIIKNKFTSSETQELNALNLKVRSIQTVVHQSLHHSQEVLGLELLGT